LSAAVSARGVRLASPKRMSALDGNRIVTFRRVSQLHAKDLASALGISRTQLYKWEADGFTHAHNSVAAAVLGWLVDLQGHRLEHVVREIRARLAVDPLRARAWLYSVVAGAPAAGMPVR
jgi:transcriptional regulator with XRE-family HTH domain